MNFISTPAFIRHLECQFNFFFLAFLPFLERPAVGVWGCSSLLT